MEKYKKDGKRHQDIEEYVKTVLDNEVKPLWPKGWMQLRYAKPEFSILKHFYMCKCGGFIFFIFQGADEREQEVVGPFYCITVSSTNQMTCFVCSMLELM